MQSEIYPFILEEEGRGIVRIFLYCILVKELKNVSFVLIIFMVINLICNRAEVVLDVVLSPH